MSPLCLGTMNLGGATGKRESIQIIHRALDSGIDVFDTAPAYNGGRSERLLGKALAKARRRDDVIIATKVYIPPSSVDARSLGPAITRACELSLRRLKTDHIDLYQLHRPIEGVSQDVILGAFDALIRKGCIRFAGCSTHPAPLLRQALDISAREGLTAYVSEQPPYNILDRRIETDVLPLCREQGLAVLPWSPLAGGLLAGRYPIHAPLPDGSRAARFAGYRERVTDAGRSAAASLADLASERSLSTAQLALLWVRDQPGVTAPIVGPRTLDQLDEALAIPDHELDDEVRCAIDAIVQPGTAVTPFS